jgi:uncharacterized protein (TIGR03067 family)
MRATLAAMAMVVLCLSARAADDEAKKDQDQLQGDWSLVSGQRDGQDIPEDFAKSLKRNVKGNMTTVTRDGEPLAKGSFTLDPTKKPKTIDIKVEGMDMPVHGIYELEGDTLKICYAAPGEERPKEFAAKAGTGHTFAVWKRDKK